MRYYCEKGLKNIVFVKGIVYENINKLGIVIKYLGVRIFCKFFYMISCG